MKFLASRHFLWSWAICLFPAEHDITYHLGSVIFRISKRELKIVTFNTNFTSIPNWMEMGDCCGVLHRTWALHAHYTTDMTRSRSHYHVYVRRDPLNILLSRRYWVVSRGSPSIGIHGCAHFWTANYPCWHSLKIHVDINVALSTTAFQLSREPSKFKLMYFSLSNQHSF